MNREAEDELRKRGYSEESIESIRRGWEQAQRGELMPMKDVIDEFQWLEDAIEEEEEDDLSQ